MMVCGLDECGRGSLAGPLVAVGVVLNKNIKGLKDSKKMTPLARFKLFKMIEKEARLILVEIISARQINNRGIAWANKEIFRKLIKRIEAEKYVVDGNLKIKVRGKSKKIVSMIRADNKVPEVMAAAIVAKVTRDKFMKELHEKYPKYGWKTNVGYGTSYHVRAISEHGTIHYHRSVFVTTALKKAGAICLE